MRSFIAVKISPDQREKLADLIKNLKKSGAEVKWVKPENLHITLKFLGEVDEKGLPNIFDSLEKSLTNEQSFQFNLKGLGCFPNLHRPRVIWVGIERGADDLSRLAGMVDDCMLGFGFEKEKRGFSPHLTIGRVKSTRLIERLTGMFKNVEFLTESCIIDEAIFYQSILKPEGPTYIPHKIIKLKPADKEG
jgi:2'-5' RNA ligase